MDTFLFIIIDEFAELIAERAEFKGELESITRVGRALGVSGAGVAEAQAAEAAAQDEHARPSAVSVGSRTHGLSRS